MHEGRGRGCSIVRTDGQWRKVTIDTCVRRKVHTNVYALHMQIKLQIHSPNVELIVAPISLSYPWSVFACPSTHGIV